MESNHQDLLPKKHPGHLQVNGLVCATSFMDGWCGPWSCTVVIRSGHPFVVKTIMTAPASLLSTLISGSVNEHRSQFVHERIFRGIARQHIAETGDRRRAKKFKKRFSR
jgi:hypothetical protein